MNISLPEPLKDYVDERVAKDGYASVSDYVRELIRQDQRRNAEKRLADLITEGLESELLPPSGAEFWANKRARIAQHKKKA